MFITRKIFQNFSNKKLSKRKIQRPFFPKGLLYLYDSYIERITFSIASVSGLPVCHARACASIIDR
jgi:hypothetical protein